MEFVKVGKNYLIKNSNGKIVSEKEKRQLEKHEIAIEQEHCKDCEIKIKKPKKNKHATSKKEVTNDIIKETNTTL